MSRNSFDPFFDPKKHLTPEQLGPMIAPTDWSVYSQQEPAVGLGSRSLQQPDFTIVRPDSDGVMAGVPGTCVFMPDTGDAAFHYKIMPGGADEGTSTLMINDHGRARSISGKALPATDPAGNIIPNFWHLPNGVQLQRIGDDLVGSQPGDSGVNSSDITYVGFFNAPGASEGKSVYGLALGNSSELSYLLSPGDNIAPSEPLAQVIFPLQQQGTNQSSVLNIDPASVTGEQFLVASWPNGGGRNGGSQLNFLDIAPDQLSNSTYTIIAPNGLDIKELEGFINSNPQLLERFNISAQADSNSNNASTLPTPEDIMQARNGTEALVVKPSNNLMVFIASPGSDTRNLAQSLIANGTFVFPESNGFQPYSPWPTPNPFPSALPTPSPIQSASAILSASITASTSALLTASATISPSDSATWTQTLSSYFQSITASITSTISQLATVSPSQTASASATYSQTISAAITNFLTATATGSAELIASATATLTQTASQSFSALVAATKTPSQLSSAIATFSATVAQAFTKTASTSPSPDAINTLATQTSTALASAASTLSATSAPIANPSATSTAGTTPPTISSSSSFSALPPSPTTVPSVMPTPALPFQGGATDNTANNTFIGEVAGGVTGSLGLLAAAVGAYLFRGRIGKFFRRPTTVENPTVNAATGLDASHVSIAVAQDTPQTTSEAIVTQNASQGNSKNAASNDSENSTPISTRGARPSTAKTSAMFGPGTIRAPETSPQSPTAQGAQRKNTEKPKGASV